MLEKIKQLACQRTLTGYYHPNYTEKYVLCIQKFVQLI